MNFTAVAKCFLNKNKILISNFTIIKYSIVILNIDFIHHARLCYCWNVLLKVEWQVWQNLLLLHFQPHCLIPIWKGNMSHGIKDKKDNSRVIILSLPLYPDLFHSHFFKWIKNQNTLQAVICFLLITLFQFFFGSKVVDFQVHGLKLIVHRWCS